MFRECRRSAPTIADLRVDDELAEWIEWVGLNEWDYRSPSGFTESHCRRLSERRSPYNACAIERRELSIADYPSVTLVHTFGGPQDFLTGDHERGEGKPLLA